MKKHEKEIMRDKRKSWKAKNEFFNKRKNEKKQAETRTARLRKEENEREKKIQN